MKKQLLIAAVAATMTSAAMADISISGDAKFEYFNTEDTANATSNTSNTEVNIKIVGKSGDTTVVLNNEFNASGDSDMDTEDMYMTTKIGDVSVKAGNWASGTSGILGEIDNGSRSTDKVSLSTSISGAKIEFGSTPSNGSSNTVTVSMPVAGFNVAVKESSDSYTAYGISGDIAGFGVRLEQQSSDTANKDVTFGNITKDVNGIALGYAWIDADTAADTVTEEDSSIFAVEMGEINNGTAVQKTDVVGVKQFSASTSVAGNTVTVKVGTLEGAAGHHDADFTQFDVKRALASGATLALTYTNKDSHNIASTATLTDTATFEADLSVKF